MVSYNAKELMHRARTRLLSSQPYYGSIAMGFKLREATDGLPTMATDMIHLFYNPEFVASLTKTQLLACVWHESQHAYMKHPLRMLDMCKCSDKHHLDHVDDHDCYIPVAQYAADEACNPPLKDAGADLIEGAVFPPQSNWTDSFEEHFKRDKKLAKKVKMCGGCSGIQAPQGKGGKGNSGLSEREKQELESQMNQRIIQAANFARSMGKLPADVERMLESLSAAKVSWADVLRRFMHSMAKDDYRMLPPNRRYISQGLYLPSLRSERVGSVLIVTDGSGSISQDIYTQFISEVVSVCADVRPEKLYHMVWDTRCCSLEEFDEYDDSSSVVRKLTGTQAWGGSVFTECFSYFEQETGAIPQVAIVLTDLEIMFPEKPSYPVMWVATTDCDAPFGEVIRIGKG